MNKRDADDIGEMAPAAGAEARRKPVLEIVEFDLDGLGALGLQHVRHPCPYPRRLYHPAAFSESAAGDNPEATVIASEAKQSIARQMDGMDRFVASAPRN